MDCVETEDRVEAARPVLKGRLRKNNGAVSDVDVLDLSLAGCLLERRALSLAPEDRVLIRLGDLSFMPGSVVWVEEQEVGVVFETELHDGVFANLKRQFEARRY